MRKTMRLASTRDRGGPVRIAGSRSNKSAALVATASSARDGKTIATTGAKSSVARVACVHAPSAGMLRAWQHSGAIAENAGALVLSALARSRQHACDITSCVARQYTYRFPAPNTPARTATASKSDAAARAARAVGRNGWKPPVIVIRAARYRSPIVTPNVFRMTLFHTTLARSGARAPPRSRARVRSRPKPRCMRSPLLLSAR